jgi:uncharacterized protein (DUF427 family)
MSQARHWVAEAASTYLEGKGASGSDARPARKGRTVTMKAIWRGRVIAESDRTLDVGGYTYFQREAVRMDLLHAVPKSENDLKCPHGVQFYDVAQDAVRSARAAWSYEAPRPTMSQVDHWIGFWEDVEVK